MECANKHCYWNFYDQCCHEDEHAYDKATPNELDCPVSLRKDFESQFFLLKDEVDELVKRRNFKELIQIKKFIEMQRPK